MQGHTMTRPMPPASSRGEAGGRGVSRAPLCGVKIQETTFRMNVRWVTPLGEETASMS